MRSIVSGFLSRCASEVVLVRRTDDSAIRGRLTGWDEHGNVTLAEAVELDRAGEVALGEVFIRGDQCASIRALRLRPEPAPVRSYSTAPPFPRRREERPRAYNPYLARRA